MNDKKLLGIIENLEKELKIFSKKIENNLDSYDNHLQEILDVIEKIEESWSYSWIGYHADLYYGNFQRPPIQRRFDSHVGFMYGAQEGWNEKNYQDIINFININYSGPSLEKINQNIKKIQIENLHAIVCSNLSFIRNFDNFDKENEILDEIEEIIWEIPSPKFTKSRMPKNYLTSDMNALAQGFRVAPHIQCESKILSSKYMIHAIQEFIKKSNKLLILIKGRMSLNPKNKSSSPSGTTDVNLNGSGIIDRNTKIILTIIGVCFSAMIAINQEAVKQIFSFNPFIVIFLTILLLGVAFILSIYLLASFFYNKYKYSTN